LQKLRAVSRAYAGFDTASVASARDGGGMNAIELDRVMATARRMRALEAEKQRREEAVAAAKAVPVVPPKVEAPPPEPVKRRLFMHEGLDLLANTGTPIHAAADGVVMNAGPNGGYGNFIRLGHAGKLTTIYGHLSRLAPDLQVGQPVLRGEVIGFVGNTGRSTASSRVRCLPPSPAALRTAAVSKPASARLTARSFCSAASISCGGAGGGGGGVTTSTTAGVTLLDGWSSGSARRPKPDVTLMVSSGCRKAGGAAAWPLASQNCSTPSLGWKR